MEKLGLVMLEVDQIRPEMRESKAEVDVFLMVADFFKSSIGEVLAVEADNLVAARDKRDRLDRITRQRVGGCR